MFLNIIGIFFILLKYMDIKFRKTGIDVGNGYGWLNGGHAYTQHGWQREGYSWLAGDLAHIWQRGGYKSFPLPSMRVLHSTSSTSFFFHKWCVWCPQSYPSLVEWGPHTHRTWMTERRVRLAELWVAHVYDRDKGTCPFYRSFMCTWSPFNTAIPPLVDWGPCTQNMYDRENGTAGWMRFAQVYGRGKCTLPFVIHMFVPPSTSHTLCLFHPYCVWRTFNTTPTPRWIGVTHKNTCMAEKRVRLAELMVAQVYDREKGVCPFYLSFMCMWHPFNQPYLFNLQSMLYVSLLGRAYPISLPMVYVLSRFRKGYRWLNEATDKAWMTERKALLTKYTHKQTQHGWWREVCLVQWGPHIKHRLYREWVLLWECKLYITWLTERRGTCDLMQTTHIAWIKMRRVMVGWPVHPSAWGSYTHGWWQEGVRLAEWEPCTHHW